MVLTLLYDGQCALCVHEMRRAARLDHQRRLAFIDISRGDLPQLLHDGGCGVEAARNLQRAAVMRRLHAIDEHDRLLVGMEAVRALYGALGLGWLTRPTAWPLLRPLFDWLYGWVADHRYVLGRCPSGQCSVGTPGEQP